jgi:hypothetical protein
MFIFERLSRKGNLFLFVKLAKLAACCKLLVIYLLIYCKKANFILIPNFLYLNLNYGKHSGKSGKIFYSTTQAT